MVNTIFYKKNSQDRIFSEHLANYTQNNDEKIKEIVVKVDNFNDGTQNLDNYVPTNFEILKSYYKGDLIEDSFRTIKTREINVKTTLH